jgi:autotransporter-associated beta strand protein
VGSSAGTGGTVSAGSGSAYGYTLHTFTTTGTSTLTLSPLAATFSGVISGSGSLTANPASGGKFTFTGNNTYAGSSTLSAGTLQLGTGSTSGSLGATSANVINNGSLIFNRSDALTYTGTFSGTGALTVSAGSLTLAGGATYTGATTLSATSTPSSISYTYNTPPSTTGFSGTGAVTIAPAASSSFTSAFTPTYTFASTLTGLTLGSASNTADITLGNAITIAGPITVDGGQVNLNNSLQATAANAGITIRAKTNIANTALATLTTNGGNILLASNVDDATDNDTTTNGYIRLDYGLNAYSNGGNITIGGGDLLGSGYAMGSSAENQTHGFRVDRALTLSSSGGNIAIRGKSYARAVQSGWGASGVGFYFLTGSGSIDSGTGTIYIDGYSQTWGSSYSSGVYFYTQQPFTITSANTTANAIKIIGKATGTSGEAWAFEQEDNVLSIAATGTGGGITLNTSQKQTYEAVMRGTWNILAKSGPITWNGKADADGVSGAAWFGPLAYWGSKSGSLVTTSASNISIAVDDFNWSNGTSPLFATTGTVEIKPASASFAQPIYSSWFTLNQNSQTVSGFTLGKDTNTSNVNINTAISANGPIKFYGGYIYASADVTATGGNILLDADTGSTLSQSTEGITLAANVDLKTINSGDITLIGRSGNGNATLAGLSSANPVTINSAGNVSLTGISYATGASSRGINLLGTTITAAGSVTMTGQHGPNSSSYGVALDSSSPVTAGTGITLESLNNTTGYVYLASTLDGGTGDVTLTGANIGTSASLRSITTSGKVTIQPDADEASFATALNTQYLNFGSTVTGLMLGKSGNTADITLGNATTIKGPITAYGGNINVNANLNTSSGGASGDVLLKASAGITHASGVSVTTNGGDVTYWADSDSTNGGYVWFKGGSINTTSAANITLSGGNVADVATLAASGFASGMTTTMGNGVTLDGVTLSSNVERAQHP